MPTITGIRTVTGQESLGAPIKPDIERIAAVPEVSNLGCAGTHAEGVTAQAAGEDVISRTAIEGVAPSSAHNVCHR